MFGQRPQSHLPVVRACLLLLDAGADPQAPLPDPVELRLRLLGARSRRCSGPTRRAHTPARRSCRPSTGSVTGSHPIGEVVDLFDRLFGVLLGLIGRTDPQMQECERPATRELAASGRPAFRPTAEPSGGSPAPACPAPAGEGSAPWRRVVSRSRPRHLRPGRPRSAYARHRGGRARSAVCPACGARRGARVDRRGLRPTRRTRVAPPCGSAPRGYGHAPGAAPGRPVTDCRRGTAQPHVPERRPGS